MTKQSVTLSIQHDIAEIWLNAPNVMNALSGNMLTQALLKLNESIASNARVIIITGEGRAFCSGADLSEAVEGADDLGETLEATYHPLFRRLAEVDLPIVSAINGPAVGAGVALAMAADISVMARSAYLQLGFVRIGLVPDSGLSWLLARSVGRVRALELALLGERVEAEQARAMGLVTRVVEDEDCLAEARAIAARLASGPGIALGLIRRQMAAALDAGYEAVLAIERANQTRAGQSADFSEGIAAFREKRTPDFKGY